VKLTKYFISAGTIKKPLRKGNCCGKETIQTPALRHTAKKLTAQGKEKE